MGSSTRPSGGAAGAPPGGGVSHGGSFHYLNAQKRILREYAKNHLGLGVRWRSSLRGVKSYRGVRLDVTPSSQWTQEELDTLYAKWGLDRPSPEELKAKTCMTVLTRDKVPPPPQPQDEEEEDGPFPPPAHPRYTQPRRVAAQRNRLVQAEDMPLDEEEYEEHSHATDLASNMSSPSHYSGATRDRNLSLSSSSLSSLQGGPATGAVGSRNRNIVYYGESDTDSISEDGDDAHLQGPSNGGGGPARRANTATKASVPSATGAGRVTSTAKSTGSACCMQGAQDHNRVVMMDELVGDFGAELLPFLGFEMGPNILGVEGEEQALPTLLEGEQMDVDKM
ncbi:Hypothetical protein NocV09_01500780 [Nannochloropsis oceanica]